MNNLILTSKKSLLLLMLLLLSTLALWPREQGAVESFRFTEQYSGASVELGTVQRSDIAFPLLFANAVTQPFHFQMRLGWGVRPGPRALWLFASQADNHGLVALSYRGRQVGVVNDQLRQHTQVPVPTLSYVGDVDIGHGRVNFDVTGSNPQLASHYAELGLLILAPRGMDQSHLLAALHDNTGAAAPDLGLLLLTLLAAFGVLYYSAHERPTTKAAHWRRGALMVGVLALLLVVADVTPQREGPLATSAAGLQSKQRSGIEAMLDSAVRKALGAVQDAQRLLPQREVADVVPPSLQRSEGSFQSRLYEARAAVPFAPVSRALFDGRLASLQALPAEQFATGMRWTLLALLVLLLLDRRFASRWSAAAALVLVSAISVLTSMRVSQGWDEFFINLRHAYMLLYHGVYSINAHSMYEASVDFLPIVATSVLALTGLSLPTAFICLSLLGNVGVVLVSWLLVLRLTGDRSWALLAALAMGMYPNVLWIGASGFSAVLMCAWILAASHFMLFSSHRRLGLVLLSTLTLVRTEGILFAALLMAYVYVLQPLPATWRNGAWAPLLRRAVLHGGIVAAPFLLSLLVRYLVYGAALPNPIIFKNTHFDGAFFAAGVGRFGQLVSSHDLHLLVLLTLALWGVNVLLCRRDAALAPWRVAIGKLMALNVVLLLFVLPYYVGGGDWFPPYWNRYGIPLNLVLTLTFLVLWYGVFRFGLRGRLGHMGLLVFSAALVLAYYHSAGYDRENFIFGTVEEARGATSYRWDRVDNLASVGEVLRQLTPADAVVASPEEATMMYFSTRDMLGLLGVSNPAMTAMPFQPIGPGNILHRKRGYASVYHSRPDVIALYEPIWRGDFGAGADLAGRVGQALQQHVFNSDNVNIAYYRVGSFRALEKMGYRNITLAFPDRVISLFIGARIEAQVIANLQAHGYQPLGIASVAYAVNPMYAQKFVPAVPQLSTELIGE